MEKSWSILPLRTVNAKEFFQLIDKNREYLLPTFPVTVTACESLWSTKAFLAERKKEQKKKKGHAFAIKEVATEQLIGYFSIKNVNEKIKRCEFAYFIDHDFQGKGYTSEIIETMIPMAFEDLEMNKIIIATSPENTASQKVALKNGFVQEGRLRQEFRNYRKELEDVLYFGLLKKNFSEK